VTDELVHYAADAGVATITLDSPDNRNALSTRLMATLSELLTAAESDDAVRVIVLTHTGRVFCSGMDLVEAQIGVTPVGAFPSILQAIWNAPKPVIARVGGPARAGGIGLLAVCDIAIAARTATFAFSEVRLGVVPAVISVPVLRRVTGAGRELMLTGEVFDGDRAAAIGLIDAAIDDVDAEVTRYVELVVQGAPEALAETKRLLRGPADTDAFEAMLALSTRFFGSADAREGIAAFREKRPPRWVPT